MSSIGRRNMPENRTGSGVTIFIVDSGVKYDLALFGGRATPYMDFTSDPPEICDAGSSYCAWDQRGDGTLAAVAAAGKVAGVASQAIIRGMKIISDEGTTKKKWLVNAARKVRDWKNDNSDSPVVMSVSPPYTDKYGWRNSKARRNTPKESQWEEAVKTAINAGVVVVLGVGDMSSDDNPVSARDVFPGFINKAILVGAALQTEWWNYSGKIEVSEYANVGGRVDIYAPGFMQSAEEDSSVDCFSAVNIYDSFAATPVVAGAAALLLQDDPTRTPEQVEKLLIGTAKRCAREELIGQLSKRGFLRVDWTSEDLEFAATANLGDLRSCSNSAA